ncbi:hypothetical protein DPMN_184307 [Dreissena polymorpha]|uniref:Uncharacterized protein n=1 Tax=Dreissena polymorpha TaxID=45954 RepID=A0A9D4DLI6_DREPO|nr:hypothetical protein DPMN_184307 [Dreissena polymorpha]
MARQRPTRIPTPHIDRIVIREVQYQFEVNLKSNFEWPWPMWAGCPRVGNGVMHKVQYQFEVHRCRNEEIIVKAILGGRGPCGRGTPELVMGPCIVVINCIDIREVQYQFEVNRCRNVVKGNFRWAWPMWAGRPMIDRIVIREFQGSSANSVGGDSGQDGRTNRQADRRRRLPQYPHAFQKAWGQ